jgi:hypothetical protein
MASVNDPAQLESSRTVLLSSHQHGPGGWTRCTTGTSRLLINHSLLPLSYLPGKRAGEKIWKEASFSPGVESNGEGWIKGPALLNTLLEWRRSTP